MTDMMLINNVLYKLFEISNSTFLLKSEIGDALKDAEGGVGSTPIHKAIEFNGKYYGYTKVKQEPKTDKDEEISSTV